MRNTPQSTRLELYCVIIVNDEKNNGLAESYREMASRESDVIFCSRLAEYRYYDMASVIELVLQSI